MKRVTKSPTSLNKGNVGVDSQKWNGSPEKVRLRLKISVENGYELTVFDVASFEPFFESTCFITSSGFSYLIHYVDAFARPSLAF